MYYFLQRFGKSVSASVIGRLPIFFHDQTIFIKDCELYTIGHSLHLTRILCQNFENCEILEKNCARLRKKRWLGYSQLILSLTLSRRRAMFDKCNLNLRHLTSFAPSVFNAQFIFCYFFLLFSVNVYLAHLLKVS